MPPVEMCAGNPINFSNGNKYQVENDFNSGGVAPLTFDRHYNSIDGLWRSKYSTRLEIIGVDIKLTTTDGRESFFRGGTNPAANLTTTELGVLFSTNYGWKYYSANNEVFEFDSTGRLIRLHNIFDLEETLAYEGDQVTVSNGVGGRFSLRYDSLYQPLSLIADGLVVNYSYNSNKRLVQLSRVYNGVSEQRNFHYEDSRNNSWLTGITDERGVRYATWTYDDQGRAISSEHAGGADKVTVTYNNDATVSVTNELGKVTHYRFQVIDGTRRISSIDGEPSANCPNSNATFTYDGRGLLKTKTDNKGNLTTYNYNSRGLEISRTEASGTPQARTITTEWHPTLFLPTMVTEPDRITRYQYDDQGRQISRTVETR